MQKAMLKFSPHNNQVQTRYNTIVNFREAASVALAVKCLHSVTYFSAVYSAHSCHSDIHIVV
jgi:hypothetical protein